MNEYEDCILFLLSKAYQRISGGFKASLKQFGLTPVQNLVLAALREADGVPIGEIGRKLHLDTATLAGTLDRLDQGGWVEKRQDEEDRRITRVWLSDQARQHGLELQQLIRDANDTALREFSLEERVLLKRLLRDLRV